MRKSCNISVALEDVLLLRLRPPASGPSCGFTRTRQCFYHRNPEPSRGTEKPQCQRNESLGLCESSDCFTSSFVGERSSHGSNNGNAKLAKRCAYFAFGFESTRSATYCLQYEEQTLQRPGGQVQLEVVVLPTR